MFGFFAALFELGEALAFEFLGDDFADGEVCGGVGRDGFEVVGLGIEGLKSGGEGLRGGESGGG